MANKSFEVVGSSSRASLIKKTILTLVGIAVFVGGLIHVFGGSKETPPPPAPALPPVAAKPDVRVVAKDPAKQAEVDQQLQQLRYYIANPTMDDADITISWLSKKYNQPPEVVVRDLFVLIERLQTLNDADLASFFNSEQNPWHDDQGYNAIIKFVSYRDYLEFVKKCATLYQGKEKG